MDGFEVHLEEKQGVSLSRYAENGEEVPDTPDRYYEVSVRSTGENPEYPAHENPLVIKLTHKFEKVKRGISGDTMYIPEDSRWTGVKLVEEDYDSDAVYISNKRLPNHKRVLLQAHFQEENGSKGHMDVGQWVRKSDQETEGWRAAMSSPVRSW